MVYLKEVARRTLTMLTITDIRNKLKPIFEKNGIKKAILFGSYATGVATESSDIDLWIDDEGHIRGLKFFGVRSEVEEMLNKKVDLIVEREIIPNSRLDTEIKKKGMTIYERRN